MNLALFDLDYTLLNGDSDYAWGEFLVAEGVVDGKDYKEKNEAFWQQYKAGTLRIEEFLEFALAPLAQHPLEQLQEWRSRYLLSRIEPMITAEALQLVRSHRNDLCAIVTATNAFVTAPIAARFGIEHLIACEAEMIGGRYTGRPSGVPSFREGKITRVRQWLAGLGHSLDGFERSLFYSDSQNDLPLLNAVSHPIAVDPDATLRAVALQKSWPIISLKPSGAAAR